MLESLPNDINAMYDKILQDDIHKDHLPLAMKVLRWLAVSYRPLSIMEISAACTIPPESELRGATTFKHGHFLTHEQLLNLLPNLVISVQAERISGGGPGYTSLAFAHFSVQEYLIGSSSANFGMQLRDAHTLVAKECLAYLFLSREMESEGSLESYASEHWQLHAVATGKLDEETRKNAFLLSASLLSVASSIDKKELPKDFIRVTGWLEDPESTQKLISLISSLREWYQLTRSDTMRLAILYPQHGIEHGIRCRVHTVSHMYAPSYEAIYPYRDQSALCANILVNDRSFSVTEDTLQLLQTLRQASTVDRLIWLHSICGDGALTPEESQTTSASSKMHMHAERTIVHLDGRLERELRGEWEFATIPELRLAALEKILYDRGKWALYYARDVVVLHNCDELSLDDIRESLDQHLADRRSDARFDPWLHNGPVPELFSGPSLRAVRNRPDGLPVRLCERGFPEIRAMLNSRQRRKNNALNRLRILRDFRDAFETRVPR